jgi:carbamoyltransferase
MDLASSIQSVTEEIVLRTGRHVHEVTGARHLCLAGGVALNCVANGRLAREGPFNRVWVQPAAGDAGAALGVALFIWYQLLGNERVAMPHDSQRGSLLGPRASADEIRALLDRTGAVFHEYETDDDLCEAVADLIAAEHVIGWFQDRMEFGPRALGARSIIGDARSPRMQSVMNLKIKFRESFRPFAPSVLAERASAYFDLPDGQESPYMLFVAPVRESVRLAPHGDATPSTGLARLHDQRSQIPAVTHIDYSARVQTVVPERNARFAQLIAAFERKTGCPVVINTSFNVRGEPIVCQPEEAYRCFLATDMDVLVLERYVLLKREQRNMPPVQREQYLAQFDLD